MEGAGWNILRPSVAWMPRLATVVAGQTVQPAKPSMQENQQHGSVDVFVGVGVGKGHIMPSLSIGPESACTTRRGPTMKPNCARSLRNSRRTANFCLSSISPSPLVRCPWQLHVMKGHPCVHLLRHRLCDFAWLQFCPDASVANHHFDAASHVTPKNFFSVVQHER
ncbi:hypothetical protein HDG33_003912 [Paraburkholderia sp. Cpub6]|nr:hypothetical protein [Paraburkholderia sp. Cpub6]